MLGNTVTVSSTLALEQIGISYLVICHCSLAEALYIAGKALCLHAKQTGILLPSRAQR